MGTDVLHLSAGGVAVELDGADRLGRGASAWVRSALRPLASPHVDSAPDVVIRVAARPRPQQRAEHGIWVGPEGAWLEGRRGLGTLLDLGGSPLVADVPPGVASSQLGHGLYLLLVGASLWRDGATLLRAAVVELGGRRLAVSGWSGSGKTRVVLELLARGGTLLGDDVVALREGRVSCVLAEVTLRPEHADQLPGAGQRIAWLPSRPRPGSDRHRPNRRSAHLAVRLRDLRRAVGERRVGTFAAGGPGAPGRLDSLLLLGMSGGGADGARALAALGASYQASHTPIAAVATQLWGQEFPRGLLPAVTDRVAAAVEALRGVPVEHRAAVRDAEDARRAADRLADLAGSR